MIEYNVTFSTAPWDISLTASDIDCQIPFFSSRQGPLAIGWHGPVGLSSLVALASNQETAPHNPSLSGVTIQTCAGANAWHMLQE